LFSDSKGETGKVSPRSFAGTIAAEIPWQHRIRKLRRRRSTESFVFAG
jgi:hypothetical protein